jgi:hypothetical protein
VTLPRGFKSEAERIATDLRARIGTDPRGELDLYHLAKELGVRVVAADTLIERDRLEELERLQAFAFSACTFDINGAAVVVYNPLRTEARWRPVSNMSGRSRGTGNRLRRHSATPPGTATRCSAQRRVVRRRRPTAWSDSGHGSIPVAHHRSRAPSDGNQSAATKVSPESTAKIALSAAALMTPENGVTPAVCQRQGRFRGLRLQRYLVALQCQ